ncbi:hypothetical protein [Ferrovibrio sp.]|uniref:hypothetical protein n=1 Tax=Ferrovibrio sp. TaxID=1917215 RepID=UPI0035B4585E
MPAPPLAAASGFFDAGPFFLADPVFFPGAALRVPLFVPISVGTAFLAAAGLAAMDFPAMDFPALDFAGPDLAPPDFALRAVTVFFPGLAGNRLDGMAFPSCRGRSSAKLGTGSSSGGPLST